MRELTEQELELLKDENCVRQNINRLEAIPRDKITQEEKDLLEALLDYRQKHCNYPSLAYYSLTEMYTLFD